MTVNIKIQDIDGNLLKEFEWVDNKSFAQMAKEQEFEIPMACGAGACFVCAAKIVKWHDCVQIDKISPPLMPLEQNKDGQYSEVLTCIWGIKSECFKDWKDHEIVLQKMI